jgi:hypothetical protein
MFVVKEMDSHGLRAEWGIEILPPSLVTLAAARCHCVAQEVLLQLGRAVEALPIHAEGLEIQRATLPPDHPSNAESLRAFGVSSHLCLGPTPAPRWLLYRISSCDGSQVCRPLPCLVGPSLVQSPVPLLSWHKDPIAQQSGWCATVWAALVAMFLQEVYVEQSRYPEAIDALEQAEAIYRSLPRTTPALGMAYVHLAKQVGFGADDTQGLRLLVACLHPWVHCSLSHRHNTYPYVLLYGLFA